MQHTFLYISLPCFARLKVMLHGTIRKDDQFSATQRCNVGTIRNNAATMLQCRVALKMIVANRITLKRETSQLHIICYGGLLPFI